MFLVSDSRKERSEKIRSLIDIDIEIAVIIAAADFEWTCRRCILSLGKSPTKYIKEKVLSGKTFSNYPNIWKKEVCSRNYSQIEEIIPNFTFKNNEAFNLRNKIIHGEYGSIKFSHGKEKIEEIISASEKLTAYAEEHRESIYQKIIRIKERK